MRRILALTLAFSALPCFNVFADHVVLKNGDSLSGTILKSDGENLTLKSEFAGEVKIQWAAIEQLSSSNPLYIQLRDGQVIHGTVSTTQGRIEVQTKETGLVSTSREAIQIIRSESEHAAYLAEVERLRNPKLSDLWSGSADAGLSLTRGNSETTTVAAGAQAARTTTRDKISLYFATLYAKNNTTGESLITASSVRGGIRYDFNLSDRVFAFGLSDIEYDKFQQLDLRLVLGGGLGYHAVKSDRTRLDLFGGGAFNQEYFSTGEDRKSGELLLGEELNYKLSSSTSLAQRLVVYPNLSEIGEFRIAFDTTAVTKLSKNFGWQITLSDRYLSNPIPGIKKNDLLLSTGIRLTFGNAK
jgi:putative salt-induced outer membrane protein YdiY